MVQCTTVAQYNSIKAKGLLLSNDSQLDCMLIDPRGKTNDEFQKIGNGSIYVFFGRSG